MTGLLMKHIRQLQFRGAGRATIITKIDLGGEVVSHKSSKLGLQIRFLPKVVNFEAHGGIRRRARLENECLNGVEVQVSLCLDSAR
jgi:hypothetical protein